TWDDAPATVTVGQPTPAVSVTATLTMGELVTWALGSVGAETVEGSADAPIVLAAPEGDLRTSIQMTVPQTPVPEPGPITVQTIGTIPEHFFHHPGHATIAVGDDLAPHIILRDASGNLTNPGEVDASCTLNPGQDPVAYSLDITPAVPTPTPTPTPIPTPT